MKKLLKAFWHGFVGGADFSQLVTERFILEGKLLKITIPISNVAARKPPKEVNYPYKNKHWFNEMQKTHTHETYVHIYTRIWMYLPIIGILPSSEYGMLSCVFKIKKTPAGVNALDNQALGQWLNQEYDEYYNHPEQGEKMKGRNTYLIAEMQQRHGDLTTPHMASQLNAYINNSGYPPIPDFIKVTFNNTEWVFYQLVKPHDRSRSDMYCLGLDENHYLVVRFDHRVDRSDKHKKWRKAANKTQQRVMEMVSLTDYVAEDSQPRLINDAVSERVINTEQDTAPEQDTTPEQEST